MQGGILVLEWEGSYFTIRMYTLGLYVVQEAKEASIREKQEVEAVPEVEEGDVKAQEGGKGGIWGRFKFKKKKPTNEDESAGNSPTIKAGHSKVQKQRERAQYNVLRHPYSASNQLPISCVHC